VSALRAAALLVSITALATACGGGATSSTNGTTTPQPQASRHGVDDEEDDDSQCTPLDPAADPTAAPPDVRRAPRHARRSLSGLAWCVLRPGTGTEHPTAADQVTVHYSGWTTDGHLFDSSHSRGEPASFGLGQVIAGWTEGVQLMTVGEVRRFWIPARLAYGDSGSGPHGLLVFDVELLSIDR
jgi:hypothetical protein